MFFVECCYVYCVLELENPLSLVLPYSTAIPCVWAQFLLESTYVHRLCMYAYTYVLLS